ATRQRRRHGLRKVGPVQMKSFRHDCSCHASQYNATTNRKWYKACFTSSNSNATVFTFFSTFRVMVLCLSFLGPLFTPVAYHDPLLFAEF
ncbi:MAG: hypothetical protein QM840_04275, partial [Verrucomicrobiota bacterium]|nr:hypothetical protein [Verrucomicrobiota bacterium]